MPRKIFVGAAGAIIAVVSLAVVEALWGWVGSILGPPVPPGAIVAFDRECPAGGEWESYQLAAGRFLLAADRTRSLHDEGGEAEHTLTVAQMPRHNHDGGKWFLVGRTGDNTVHAETDNVGHNEINIRHAFSMVPMGKGDPHNNMPPFLVVNFCKKNR